MTTHHEAIRAEQLIAKSRVAELMAKGKSRLTASGIACAEERARTVDDYTSRTTFTPPAA